MRLTDRNQAVPLADGRVLLDRERERRELDELLATTRSGSSRALVLRGEAGIGKTALLRYATASAGGMQVARIVGAESEVDLGFAGLHQLLVPFLPRVERLPPPQREALGSAFGLVAAPPGDLFLVGLATQTLLADAALERPVLCVVDDAQWVDHASIGVLGFVARRLLADRIGMLFAVREEDGSPPALDGLDDRRLQGLPDDAARELVASFGLAGMDARVGERLMFETRGNPLALVELGGALTEQGLTRDEPLRRPPPIATRLEDRFRSRVQALPTNTQTLLLLAAAQEVGDPALLWRAAEQLGVSRQAADHPELRRLLSIEPRVEFHHPLMRSAIYQSAPLSERRRAHDALAAAIDPELDPDRRALHRAEAALGPDEELAAELERSAGRAQLRGGTASAAAFLERAVELTPEPATRAMRQLLASAAQLRVGAFERAEILLAEIAPAMPDPLARAQSKRVAAAIAFHHGRAGGSAELLLAAAHTLGEGDRSAARRVMLEALEAAYWAERFNHAVAPADVAAAARTLSLEDQSTENLLLSGYSERFLHGYSAAVELWQRAVNQFLDEQGLTPEPWMAMLYNASGELLDFDAHRAVSERLVALTREAGWLHTLPQALNSHVWTVLQTGPLADAEALVTEAFEIAAATGGMTMPGTRNIGSLMVKVWGGLDEEARRIAEQVVREATAHELGLGVSIAKLMLAKLELGAGRYEEAAGHALDVTKHDPLYLGTLALPEAIEATIRIGERDAAESALSRLSERAQSSGAAWGLGLLARCRALVSNSGDAESHFTHSIALLERSGVVCDLGRTHLLYGEWLRRHRRRRDARVHLRSALKMLRVSGPLLFADRAHGELLATGETARRRVIDTREDLTPQESRVARLAGEGASNQEIATQLFISQTTVAHHLRKAFQKLDVTSRTRLAAALSQHDGGSTRLLGVSVPAAPARCAGRPRSDHPLDRSRSA